jgi:hypothetical protein
MKCQIERPQYSIGGVGINDEALRASWQYELDIIKLVGSFRWVGYIITQPWSECDW